MGGVAMQNTITKADNKAKVLELLNKAIDQADEACERGCCYLSCDACPISQMVKYINEAYNYAVGEEKND